MSTSYPDGLNGQMRQSEDRLDDPIRLPLVFKLWLVNYLQSELELSKFSGYAKLATGAGSSGSGAGTTGTIPAAGTVPTSGTGFTYTHTNGSGVYVFTFASAYAATPTIIVNANSDDFSARVTAKSPSGFTVHVKTIVPYPSGVGALADGPFEFIVVRTI